MKNSKIVAAMSAAAMALSMFAVVPAAAYDVQDGTKGLLVVDTNNGNAVHYDLMQNNYNPKEVESVTFTFTGEGAYFSGAFMTQSSKKSWEQDDNKWTWSTGTDKAMAAVKNDDGSYSVTFEVGDYFADYEEEYTWAWIVVQQHWASDNTGAELKENNITITDVTVKTVEKEDPKEDPKDDPTEDPKDDPKDDPTEDPKDDPKDDPVVDPEIPDDETTTPECDCTTDCECTSCECTTDCQCTTDCECTDGETTPGDINGDGKIDIKDLMLVTAHLKKVEAITDKKARKAADVNKSNSIDIGDVTMIAGHVKGVQTLYTDKK